MTPPDTRERIKELFTLFKLPTMAAECVRRFSDAGHDGALEVLAETLEAELGERRVRRCDRLLRASKLPPAKTFETLDPKRLPKGISPRLHELASSDVLERAVNILCFGLPGTGKTHAACALGHALVQADTPSSSRQRSSSCRSFSLPSATLPCHERCAGSTTSRPSFSTT